MVSAKVGKDMGGLVQQRITVIGILRCELGSRKLQWTCPKETYVVEKKNFIKKFG